MLYLKFYGTIKFRNQFHQLQANLMLKQLFISVIKDCLASLRHHNVMTIMILALGCEIENPDVEQCVPHGSYQSLQRAAHSITDQKLVLSLLRANLMLKLLFTNVVKYCLSSSRYQNVTVDMMYALGCSQIVNQGMKQHVQRGSHQSLQRAAHSITD